MNSKKTKSHQITKKFSNTNTNYKNPGSSSRQISSKVTTTTSFKKNASENALIKNKINTLERNIVDQEKVLKNILNKVNIEKNPEKPSKIKEENFYKKENVKLMEKYEIQIAGLKKNLDFVMEENAYYKRALDNQAQTNEKDAEYEIELLRKKNFDLEQLLKQKEIVEEEKEASHRLQMKNLNERVLEFQKLVGRLSDYEIEIEELNKKYEFKENELKRMQSFYEEKIERHKKSQFEQKKEWTLIYNELYEELKFLKKELENISQKSLLSSTRKMDDINRRMSDLKK